MTRQGLFSDFPDISKQEWLDKISSELKNKTIDDLNWKLDELTISPFAHQSDIDTYSNLSFKNDNVWGIGENFYIHDLKKSNQQILEALIHGVNSPNFTFSSVPNDKDLDTLFKDVDLSIISVFFDGNAIQNKPIETAKSIKNWWNKNYPNSIMKGGFRYFKSFDSVILKSLLTIFQKDEMTIFRIDSESFYTGKEFVVDELKSMIFDITSFFDTLKSDIPIEKLIDKIEIPFGINQSYFLNISKIRAFKILWANVIKAYQVENIKLPFTSAFFVPSAFDDKNYTNMIRATTMAMSAIVGSVDVLTIQPSNLSDKAFAKRVARNLHHILAMESHFDHVVDPAAGSYYIENLTLQISKAVWTKLQSS